MTCGVNELAPSFEVRSGDTHTAITADTGIRDSEHSIVTRAHWPLHYSARQLLNWGVGGRPVVSFHMFWMFLEHFNESKHQQQRGIPETNSEKPSLAEPISTAACYDWPTRTAKLARAHSVSFTETAEAEAFHDSVSVTQTRRSESAGYNHCCLPESGDGWPRLGNPEMNGVGRITENKWMRRLRSDLRIVLDLILRSDLRFGPAQNEHLVVRTDSGLLEPLARLAKEGEKICRASGPAVNVEACWIPVWCQLLPIGSYRENAIANESEAGDSLT